MCDPLESRELPEGKGSLGAGDRQRGIPPRLEHEPVGDNRSLGGCGAEACSTRLPRSTSSPFTELPSEACAAELRSPEKKNHMEYFDWFRTHIYIKSWQFKWPKLFHLHSRLPAGGGGDPGRSACDQAAAASASLWLSSSCQMMELESGTVSASGIPEPVTATLAGPGSWTQTHQTACNKTITAWYLKLNLDLLWWQVPGKLLAPPCVFSFGSVCWFGGIQSAVHST